ncbi:MAG TPA: hypothetical protein VFN08_16225 [Gemmatimonadales bacterium]|jgi:hypothetical protein|nr:hypothetical protein [Gemmatimonadales bacterium]
MSTTNDRRLALNVHRAVRATDPSVHIFLQRMVRQPNGMLSVTPVCTSLAQIEEEIRELQLELEGILQEARNAYAAKARTSA